MVHVGSGSEPPPKPARYSERTRHDFWRNRSGALQRANADSRHQRSWRPDYACGKNIAGPTTEDTQRCPFGKTILLGPYNFEADISLYKVFSITERVKLRLNIDAFNAFKAESCAASKADCQCGRVFASRFGGRTESFSCATAHSDGEVSAGLLCGRACAGAITSFPKRL